MKIAIVSAADSVTGAARAAARLHKLQVKSNCDSTMLVGSRTDKSWRVIGPKTGFAKVLPHIMPRINAQIMRLQGNGNSILHSPALFGSPAYNLIQSFPADVLNLHWVNHDFLSIRQIGGLKGPVVWTLHDTWAFCGAEHYPSSLEDQRYRYGYTADTRSADSKGLDIDRMVWKLKLRNWRKPMHIVTPSRWLAETARNSLLFREWPISVIPNAVPLDVFRPWDRSAGRTMFGLPQDRQLVLFGAIGGTSSPIKGWQYLQSALLHLSSTNRNLAAVVLGQAAPKDPIQVGMPTFHIPHLFDDTSLAMLYSAVDVVVVPSKLENLSQMATEAQSCGIPVVAFNCGGMPDAVAHGKTGYLAQPYDSIDLSIGISTVLTKQASDPSVRVAIRERAARVWSEETINSRYLEVYQTAIEENATNIDKKDTC